MSARDKLIVGVIFFSAVAILIIKLTSATAAGQMTLYLHAEPSDDNGSFNNLTLTKPEISSYNAPSSTSTTNTAATPPTTFCAASTNTTTFNEIDISGGNRATGNRCVGTFISMPVGQTFSMSTGDGSSTVSGVVWSSKSSTSLTETPTFYIYRWSGTGTTVSSGDLIATLTGTNPTTANTITQSTFASTAPANNISFLATDRIIVIATLNITVNSANGATTSMYYDHFSQAVSKITLKYTASTPNKPALTGSLDDDFTTGTANTNCTTGGVTINTKWTCAQGSATNSTGSVNEGDSGGTTGDSSDWLELTNTDTAAITPSDFGTTPSNTFIYQTLPAYNSAGNVRTVVNSSKTVSFSTPRNTSGLVLWTSDTDFLEVDISRNTGQVLVDINNSGGVSISAIDVASLSFSVVWLGFSYDGSSYQAQYSMDGTTWNNIGSAITHSNFTRVGLNTIQGDTSRASSYSTAFEWFQYTFQYINYNQTSYQFFNNANSTSPGSAVGSQNTPIDLSSLSQKFRLRQLVNADASVSSNSNSLSTNSLSVGSPAMVGIGLDGLAQLFYNDGSSMIFVKCNNKICTSHTDTVIDSTVGANNNNEAITIGPDGYARLAYQVLNGDGLNFVRCTNINCSTKVTTSLNSGASTGTHPFITMGADGFPRLSYNNVNVTAFVYCADINCTSNIQNSTVISASINGPAFVAMASDGFARIAIYDNLNHAVQYVQCFNNDCSSNSMQTVDSTNVGLTAFSLGADGNGRILYPLDNTHVNFARCTTADCSAKNITSLDTVSNIGNDPGSVVMAADGFARVAYVDTSARILKYVVCTNSNCSSNTMTTFGDAYQRVSMALDSGNTPFLAYSNSAFSSTYLITNTGLLNEQYADMSSYGSCSAIPSGNWADIGTATPISYYDNSSPSSNDTISTTANDPTESGQTVATQTYNEANNFYNTATFGGTIDGMWDLSLYLNGAPSNTTYCLRTDTVKGAAFTTYTNYPEVTTPPPPAAPTLLSPESGAAGQSTATLFQLKSTDTGSNYLEYKILLYNSDCSTGLQTFDQTSSQKGWLQQDQQNSTAYTSSTSLGGSSTAFFGGASLSANTTYCWKAASIDPGGTNTFSSFSATQLFTTGNTTSGDVKIQGGGTIRGGSIVR